MQHLHSILLMKQIWKVSQTDFLTHFNQILKQHSFQFPNVAIAFLDFIFCDNKLSSYGFSAKNSPKKSQVVGFLNEFYLSEFRQIFLPAHFLRFYFSTNSFTAKPQRLSWHHTESASAPQQRLSWQNTEFLTQKRLSWQPNELAKATHTRLSGHNCEISNLSKFPFSHTKNFWNSDQNFSYSFSCLFSWSDQKTRDIFELCMGMEPSVDTPPFVVRTFLRFTDAIGTILKKQPNIYKLNPSHQLYSSIQR